MLTVLLATRNRGVILGSVLESLCQVRAPMSGWKLLVVDNGSTDQTGRVISSFTSRLPLEFLREQRLGKNCALNAGLAHAEGDLIVFMDDDVTALIVAFTISPQCIWMLTRILSRTLRCRGTRLGLFGMT